MGGGGDGGYSARQDQDDKRKAEARAAINAIFGISSPAPSGSSAAPTSGRSGLPQFAPGMPYRGGDRAAIPAEPGRQQTLGLSDEMGPAAPTEAERNKAGLDALYGKVRGDAFDSGKRQLDEQKTEQDRNLKFELFSRGLRGGSADIDQNARLGRAYTDGLTRVSANADGLVSNLRSNDEQSRIGLLQGIDSGMDQGSALSSALNQLRNNSDQAYAQAQGQVFGDILGVGGGFYANNQRSKGQQRGQQWWQSQRPSSALNTSSAPSISFAG